MFSGWMALTLIVIILSAMFFIGFRGMFKDINKIKEEKEMFHDGFDGEHVKGEQVIFDFESIYGDKNTVFQIILFLFIGFIIAIFLSGGFAHVGGKALLIAFVIIIVACIPRVFMNGGAYWVVTKNYLAEISNDKIWFVIHRKDVTKVEKHMNQRTHNDTITITYRDENNNEKTIDLRSIANTNETYSYLSDWSNKLVINQKIDYADNWNNSPINQIDNIMGEELIFRVVQSDSTPDNTRDEFYWGFSKTYMVEGIGGAFWDPVNKANILDIIRAENSLIFKLNPAIKYPNKWNDKSKDNLIIIDKVNNIDDVERFLVNWIE